MPNAFASLSARERLRRLADAYASLTDEAAELAADVLETLTRRLDPLAASLALAPDDDEPLTDEDRAAIAEGLADLAAGRGVTLDAACAELGIAPAALDAARRALEDEDGAAA